MTSQPPRSFCVSYVAVSTVGVVTNSAIAFVTQRPPWRPVVRKRFLSPDSSLLLTSTQTLILDFSVGYAPLPSLFSCTFKGMSQIWPGGAGGHETSTVVV